MNKIFCKSLWKFKEKPEVRPKNHQWKYLFLFLQLKDIAMIYLWTDFLEQITPKEQKSINKATGSRRTPAQYILAPNSLSKEDLKIKVSHKLESLKTTY